MKTRLSLKHIHGHVMELHEALMQVLDNQCQHGKTLGKIMASNAELTAKLDTLGVGLTEVSDQFNKGFAEIEKQIADLKAAGGTTPEQDAKFDAILAQVAALKSGTQKLDDLNPDA